MLSSLFSLFWVFFLDVFKASPARRFHHVTNHRDSSPETRPILSHPSRCASVSAKFPNLRTSHPLRLAPEQIVGRFPRTNHADQSAAQSHGTETRERPRNMEQSNSCAARLTAHRLLEGTDNPALKNVPSPNLVRRRRPDPAHSVNTPSDVSSLRPTLSNGTF